MENLWGDIAWSTAFLHLLFIILSKDSKAEVCYANFILWIIIDRLDKYVVKLDVSMYNLFNGEKVHGKQHLFHDHAYFLLTHVSLFLHDI